MAGMPHIEGDRSIARQFFSGLNVTRSRSLKFLCCTICCTKCNTSDMHFPQHQRLKSLMRNHFRTVSPPFWAPRVPLQDPYHCGGGYTAPSWRFGSLASETWGVAPMADFERLTSQAKVFGGPVLLMAGACNSWTGAALQEQHQGVFHRADLSVIANAGHDVIWDNPEASLVDIRAFLNAGNEE